MREAHLQACDHAINHAHHTVPVWLHAGRHIQQEQHIIAIGDLWLTSEVSLHLGLL